jgi:hypothetical protein
MASQIDPTKPVDNIPAVKSELRANLQHAKDEIEELQRQTSLAWLIALGVQSV